MGRELTVRISLRTVGLILMTLVAVWMLIVLHRVWILLFIAILLAVGLSGAVNFLQSLRVPRALSILLMYAVLLFVLAGTAFILVPLVSQQIRLLSVQLPQYVSALVRRGSELIGERFPELRDTLPTGEFAQRASSAIPGLLGNVGSAAISLGRATFGFVINLLVVLVLAFFLLSRRNVLGRTVSLLVPLRHQAQVTDVGRVIGVRLGRWVVGQLIVATFYAVCFGTGLAILKVPYAVSLGVIGGLLELIPYVGGFVATLLTMIVAFTVQPILALWVLGLHLVVGNIEVHVLAPKVMGRAVDTHPVVAILAMFSGIELLGFVGAFIAIPLAVVGQALVEEFWIKRISAPQQRIQAASAELSAPALLDGEVAGPASVQPDPAA